MNTCCPDNALLRGYMLGDLEVTGEEAIDEHLERCPTCLVALETLDRQAHGAFHRLTTSPPRPPVEDPELSRLVAEVKQLGRRDTEVNGATSPSQPDVGSVLGPYVLLDHIGSGGMGRVFQAEHTRMKRRVALKMLAPEWLRSAGARARFQREIEAIARLQSPHIVAAHDAGECGGWDYLVMEYVEGRNLADTVKADGPLPVARALDYVLQAARGLAHAHAAGIVHRDVKPANLLVDNRGNVKILDLGLARVRLGEEGSSASALTAQHVMGTAAFMAPEQAADTHKVDARADIYSLGCTLYYLLTGQPPYAGASAIDTLLAHRQQPIPSIRDSRRDCPAEVDELTRWLLAKNPDERPESLAPVIARLEAMLEGEKPCSASESKLRRPSRRLAAGLLGLAACLILILVLPHLRGIGGKEGPEPPPLAQGPPPSPPLTQSPPEELPLPRPAVPNVVPQPPLPPVVLAPLAIDMVRIEPGMFTMGSAPGPFPDEQPAHEVKITQPFWLGKTKITQAQYTAVMGVNPSAFRHDGRFANLLKSKAGDTGQHPVESISWMDAVRFCNRLSERNGLAPFYQVDDPLTPSSPPGGRGGGEGGVKVLGGTGYRLPTEAEWEYACRAGSKTTWFFGDDAKDLGDFAWFGGNSGDTTHPVALKKPNPFGLHDMLGNVSEWVWDRYDPDYYKRSPISDPPGSSQGTSRGHRGGAWNMAAEQTRPAFRSGVGMTYGTFFTIVGMRVARNVDPAQRR